MTLRKPLWLQPLQQAPCPDFIMGIPAVKL
jgi:hypothetical protein